MRVVSPAVAAALAGPTVPVAALVEMDLSPPLYLNSANLDMVLNGVTYLGTRGLGKVEAVRETASEVAQLRFEMSGVSSATLALVLAEPVQGKPVRLRMAIFDPATHQVLEVRTRWAGALDVMTSRREGPSAVISVTAEHAGIDLLRPAVSLYSDDEQQRLYPGDLFFQYLSELSESRIVWPAASWGRA